MLALWNTIESGRTRKADEVDDTEDELRSPKRRKTDTKAAVTNTATWIEHLVRHVQLTDTVASFSEDRTYALAIKALIEHYQAQEREFGFRIQITGRRIPMLVLAQTVNISQRASALENATNFRLCTLDASTTALGCLSAALAADLLVVHVDALVAKLVNGDLSLDQLSLLILDQSMEHEAQELCERFFACLRTISTQICPRMLVAQAQRDLPPTAPLEQLTRALGCVQFEPPTAALHAEVTVVYHPASPAGDTDAPSTKLIAELEAGAKLDLHIQAARKIQRDFGACAVDLWWKEMFPSWSAIVPSDLANIVATRPISRPVQTGAKRNITEKLARLLSLLGDVLKGRSGAAGCTVFVHRDDFVVPLAKILVSIPSQPYGVEGFTTTGQSGPMLSVCSSLVEHPEAVSTLLVICVDAPPDVLAYARCLSVVKPGGQLIIISEDSGDQRRHIRTFLERSDLLAGWIPWFGTPESSVAPFQLDCPSFSSASLSVDRAPGPLGDEFVHPVTGACITLQTASDVVHRLASRYAAQERGRGALLPLFEYTTTGDAVSCTVKLPSSAPVTRLQGHPRSNMSDSRRSVCLQLCKLLHELGHLDYHDIPTTFRPLVKIEGAPPPVNSETSDKAVRRYPRQSTVFWDRRSRPSILHAYRLRVDEERKLREVYKPILLVTREPLPPLPRIHLFFDGVPVNVDVTPAKSPFVVAAERVELLHSYTTRTLRGMVNKPFKSSADEMPYFLAPVELADDALAEETWVNELAPSVKSFVVPPQPEDLARDSESIQELILQDRWNEFTRRFRVIGLRPDLNPRSRPPPDAAGVQHESFIAQYEAHIKGRGTAALLKDESQPLLEVDRLEGLINRLIPAARAEEPPAPPKFLIPELCPKFVIRASVFKTAHLVPSIVRCIDDLLLTKMLNHHFFDDAIDEGHLLTAISSPALCSEHNYDRLELLGDAILKCLVSASIFVRNPTWAEAAMHNARQLVISNRSLMTAVRDAGLPSFILSKPLSVRTWVPPGVQFEQPRPKPLTDEDALIPDKVAAYAVAVERQDRGDAMARARRLQDASEHVLGDKVIADVSEAIIGAAFISGGKNLAIRAAQRLGISLQDHTDVDYASLSQFSSQSALLKAETLHLVQGWVGRPLRRPQFLQQALTQSVGSNGRPTYERLEFLGDALLELLVVRYNWRHAQLDQEALTLTKAAMVENKTLAAFCVHIGLHNHIIHNSPQVRDRITGYCKSLERARVAESTLAQQEERPPAQYWLDVDCPKVLSDVVEAVLGALFISEDCDVAAVEAFFQSVLRPFYDQHIRLNSLSSHPTAVLFKIMEASSCQDFQLKKTTSRPDAHQQDVVVHGAILASAVGPTSDAAARRASIAALDMLEQDQGFLRRTCDCRSKQAESKQAKKAERAAQGKGGGKKGSKVQAAVVPTTTD